MRHRSTARALTILLGAAIAAAPAVLAAPAAELVFEIAQPDGTRLQLINRGDEWNNWIEALDGYTVAPGEDGYWYFVKEYVDGKARLGETRAHLTPPQGIAKHVRPQQPPGRPDLFYTSPVEALLKAPRGSFSGTILYILAEFGGRAGTTSEASWASMIASEIADYFSDASYAQATLAPAQESSGLPDNGVVNWINVGATHPDTGGNTDDRNRQLARDAIIAADPFVDFASYDGDLDGYVDVDELAVVVIVAGYEHAYAPAYSPNVHAHKWGLGGTVAAPVLDGVRVGDWHAGAGGYAQFGELHRTSSTNQHQATIGIQIHELAHLVFGLPDLYDTDGSSSGIGAFGVMGSGNWGRASTDTWSGQTPVLPCAWSRYVLGWADGHPGAGTVSVTAAGSQFATSANSVFRASTAFSNEYFLVENRQSSGYDRGLWRWLGSFGGLAIWHVDESRSNNTDDAHRLVDLEEADGIEMGSSAGEADDLWWAGNATVFDATTTPDSDLYSGAASSVALYDVSTSFVNMTLRFGVAGDTNELTIYNDGDATLSITSMALDSPADWIAWQPQAPFDVATGGSIVVTVTVDFGLAPEGDSTRRLLIHSNDPDESPYPGGVDIVVHNSASYLLSVTKAGNGSGTVVSFPAGIDCGPDCEESYVTGTFVDLSAFPAAGSLFAGWSGDPDCDDATVVMLGDKSCTANFVLCVGTEDLCDAVDNDCDGMVDELPEDAGFSIPGDKETFCWVPLSGGETYEAVRSEQPGFPEGCATYQTANTCWTDTATPASGQVFFYLARVMTPFAGSWGGATGEERVEVCGTPTTTTTTTTSTTTSSTTTTTTIPPTSTTTTTTLTTSTTLPTTSTTTLPPSSTTTTTTSLPPTTTTTMMTTTTTWFAFAAPLPAAGLPGEPSASVARQRRSTGIDGERAPQPRTRRVVSLGLWTFGGLALLFGTLLGGGTRRRRHFAAPKEEVTQPVRGRRPPAPAPGVTLGLPVYNEAEILAQNVAAIRDHLRRSGLRHEIIIGSNGSTDETVAIAECLSAAWPEVRCIHLARRGPGRVFRRFVEMARYPVLITLDMDLSVGPEFVTAAAPLLSDHDMVIGSKHQGQERRCWLRRTASQVYIAVARTLLGLRWDDYSIGAKGYRVEFLRQASSMLVDGTAYVVNLAWFADRHDFRVAELAVDCEDDRASRFNLVREGVYRGLHLLALGARSWLPPAGYARVYGAGAPMRRESPRRSSAA